MTPDEYRSAIAELGLTQIKAAMALGIGKRTSRRYAKIGAPEHINLALEGLKARKNG